MQGVAVSSSKVAGCLFVFLDCFPNGPFIGSHHIAPLNLHTRNTEINHCLHPQLKGNFFCVHNSFTELTKLPSCYHPFLPHSLHHSSNVGKSNSEPVITCQHHGLGNSYDLSTKVCRQHLTRFVRIFPSLSG